MKIRILSLFCFLLIAVLLLSSCGNKTQEAADLDMAQKEAAIQIGLSFDSFVIERWIRDRDMFVSTAKGLGAEVNVQVANGVVKEQISQIEYFIKKKMDVIVVVAIDGKALSEVVKKAQNAGIKIVCYDRIIENANTDLYISFDNRRVGELMGEALLEAYPEGGNILAIYGSRTDKNVEQLKEGLTSTLEGSKLKIVKSDYCDNWLAEIAYEKTNEGLGEQKNIVGIMCGNDDLAGQAIRALSENRLAGKMSVVAQDAELAACQRIVEGTQYMTVYKPMELEARAAAYMAVALGKGVDITKENEYMYTTEKISDGISEIPYYRLEPIGVTRDNLDEEIISAGFHTREDVYLNIKSSQ